MGYTILDDKVYYISIQNLYEVRLVESEGKDFEILNEYMVKIKITFTMKKGKWKGEK